MTRIAIVISLAIVALFYLSVTTTSVSEPMVFFDPVVKKANQLSFKFEFGDQDTAFVDVFYPPGKILLGPESHAPNDSLIVFENGLNIGGAELPEKVRTFRSTSSELISIPGFSGKKDGIHWGFYARGRCVYKIQTEGKLKKAVNVLKPELVNQDEELFRSFLPRVNMQQLIQGKWETLTHFAVPEVGMVYYFAPADTINVQLQSALMRVFYYPDRMVVEAASPIEYQDEYSLELNAKGGYWPPEWEWQKGGFFESFRSAKFPVGEIFKYSHRTLPAGQYTLSIRILKETIPQQWDQVLVFMGPDIRTNSFGSRYISFWPMIPTPENICLQSDQQEKGYPGGLVFPLWAVKRCLELGPGFVHPDTRNKAEYGDVIQEYYRNKRK